LTILMIPAIIGMFLNLKKFHRYKQLQRWYFQMAQIFNKGMYWFFYYPISRVLFIFTTNSSLKKVTIGMMVIMFAVSFVSGFQIANSNLGLLINENRLFRQYERTDRAIENHYETNLNGSERLFSALIPSENVKGDLLKVFVPIFYNEELVMNDLCGEWQEEESLSEDENRANRREHWINCVNQYHQFYVNDSLYNVQLSRFVHPNKGEDGVLTFLSTKHFLFGKNMLRIEKIKADSSVYRTINVQFWFSEN